MNNKKIIYLDYSATTPIDPKLTSLIRQNEKYFANASSLHSLGRASKQKLDESRKKIADILKVEASEIIFTGSGTEADNLALFGLARANKKNGNEIIISTIEHKAVMEAVKQLKKEGFVIHFTPVDKNGLVDLQKFSELINDRTILVSIIYANNEIGVIQPLKKISQLIKSKNPKTIFHSDGCQASNYLDLAINKLEVDALSLSSSKVYAPKGVGCLYVNKKCLLEPIIVGGDQEFGKRSGTENLHAIVVFAHALELAQNLKVKESKRLTPLRDYFIKQAEKNIDKIRINGSKSKRLPNNVNISFAGAEGESLLLLLDEKGICCSTGSACSAQDLNPSHVLMALNIPIELVHCSLRFSLGRFTTKKEIDYCLQNLYLAVKKIRQISSLT